MSILKYVQVLTNRVQEAVTAGRRSAWMSGMAETGEHDLTVVTRTRYGALTSHPLVYLVR